MGTTVKKLIALFLLMTLFATCACSPARPREPEKITIIEEGSFFRGFEVSGEYVRIYCHYEVKNNTSEQLKFKIKGIFQADVKGGLLKEATLYAANIGMGVHGPLEYEFTIAPNWEIGCEVVFVGEASGAETKHDRLLPETEIEYISES